ncbi:hypothetical protein PoB_006959200 [Plakobranchus ocellatus]|uniref:Uncharacterized protein n=1 Tax=Plakobranchus ocellatus TaxID=259542 RepID=A0AAV4DGI7_9GAST|nr:hypothetical protein PoB_006959200 [Plakobranchus ocellatus]
MGNNPLSPTYWRESVHGRQPTVTHVLERQYMGDNPLLPTYWKEAVHGQQPTVAHVLERGSTWVTTHCCPRTGKRQYMGDNPLFPRTGKRQYMGNNLLSPMYCLFPVHGQQLAVAHVLPLSSTWATTCCRPCTASFQYMGNILLLPKYW